MLQKSIIYIMTLSLSLSGNLFAADFLKAPVAPQYETCTPIEHDNGDGTKYSIQDSACLGRNAQKQREYAALVEAYNRSQRMMSADASTQVKPVEPTYKVCQTVDNGNGSFYADQQCEHTNQQLKRDYDIQMSGWNTMQQQEANKNQSAAQLQAEKDAAALKAQSATDALRQAQQKNAESAQKSNSASDITMGLSVVAGAAFAVSCMGFGATCNYAYLAASIAFGMMSAKNGAQANANDMSAYSACQAQAQLSGSAGSCVQPPSYTPPTGPVASTLVPGTFDAKGNCVASNKATCDAIISGLPKGVSIQDAIKGTQTFAASPPYKINKDGSVTATKNGKTYKPSDFSSLADMKAAGFTDAQAQQALGMMNKVTAGNGLDNLKKDLNGSGSDKSASMDFGGASIAGSGSDGGAAGGKGNSSSGAVGSKGIDGSGDGKGNGRSPAGEGLTRDFNGEAIGAAGDDIFSMMNRRYKTKTAQDSFMSN